MNVLEGPRLYYSLFGARGLLWGAVARVLRKSIQVEVEVPGITHPVNLRLRTTDVGSCQEILLRTPYEWRFPEPPRVIVDVGANIGFASVSYASRYPDARIIAVEPEPSNYEVLRKNVAPYANVTPVKAALWKDARPLAIVDTGGGHTTFRIRNESNGAASAPASGVTLDQLMADLGIDFIDLLKVDIEGAEREVFEDPEAWIGRVGVIAVELHDWIQLGCSESVRRAAKEFELEWHKGDVTYLARRSYAAEQISESAVPAESPRVAPGRVNGKFPLRILRAS